jgi:hypothetical protein
VVKAGKRDSAAVAPGIEKPASDAAQDAVLDDVDELLNCLDCEQAVEHEEDESLDILDDADELEAPSIPDGSNDAGPVPWLDRYETTSHLIGQLEDTLRMMEEEGVNLTEAWEMANTARSLLDSADVVQALIFANRSFNMARQVHRMGSSGAAAS